MQFKFPNHVRRLAFAGFLCVCAFTIDTNHVKVVGKSLLANDYINLHGGHCNP